MDGWRTISVALRLDHSDYSRGTKAAAADTKKLGAEVEQTQKKMGTGWDQTSTGLRKVNQDLKATETQAERTAKGGMSLKSALLGIGVGIGIRKVVDELEQAQQVSAQTAAVIKSTGNAAEVSAAQQDKMVQSLSKVAAVDDEVVAHSANVLRTFTKIRGADTFEQALKSAADLTGLLGTDLQGAALQVGKALNDPVKGVNALTRAGVSFTAEEREKIKVMVQSGDVAGAQSVILSELQRQFGGQAAANATSTARMKVAFDNAAESLGGSLAPALTLAAKAVEFAANGFQKIPAPLQAFTVAALAGAYVVPKLVSGWRSAVDAARDLKSGIGKAIESMGGLGNASIAGGAAVAGLAYGMYLVTDEEARMSARARALADSIKAVADQALSTGEAVKDVFTDKSLVDFAGDFGATFDALGISIADIRDGVTGSAADFNRLFAAAAAADPSFVLSKAGVALGNLRREYVGATERVNQQRDATKQLNTTTGESAAKHRSLADAVHEASSSMGAQASAQSRLLETTNMVNTAVTAVAEKQRALRDAARAVVDAERAAEAADRSVAASKRSLQQAIQSVVDARKQAAASVRAEIDAEKQAAQAVDDVATAAKDLAEAERAAAGDSDAMRAALKDVATAQADLTAAQQNTLDAQKELDQATRDYGHTLAGLQDQAGGAADDVISAEIRLRKAKAELANLKPGSTADDRTEAEIAIREAERRLHAAQNAAAEAKATLDRNTVNGAAGSDAVVAAHDKVTTAAENEATANDKLNTAVQNVAGVQLAADAALEAAHKTLTEKIDAVAAANQRVIDAKDAVVASHGAIQSAVQGVRDSEQGVADAIYSAQGARQNVQDAKDKYVTAQGELAHADDVAKEAVHQHDRALKDLSATLATEGTLRTRLRNTKKEVDDLAAAMRNAFTPPAGGSSGGGSGGSIFGFLRDSGTGTKQPAKGTKSIGGDKESADTGTGSDATDYTSIKRALRGQGKKGDGTGNKGNEHPEPTSLQKAIDAVLAADAAHRKLGAAEYAKWSKALIALFTRKHHPSDWDPRGHKGVPVGNVALAVGNLPSSAEGDPMFKDMAAWAGTHNPVGISNIIPGQIPYGATQQHTIDYPELARAIAHAMPERIYVEAPKIDARGMTPGSAATVVGAELAARLSAATTKGRRT